MTTPSHLPAAPTDADRPLRSQPTEALTFALGYVAARPVTADQFGGVCALVEELMARPGEADPGPLGGWDRRSAFGVLMSAIPRELARSITLLYQAHRGQRWARTGQYRPGR